jgi:hypothetical protein
MMPGFKRLCLLAMCIVCVIARAQEKASIAVPVDGHEVMQHTNIPAVSFHFDSSKLAPPPGVIGGGWNMAMVHLVIGPNGHVQSAHCLGGPEEICSVAERLELERTYKPFVRDGHPVSVEFDDWVFVYPPERWSTKHVDFPAVRNMSGVSIALESENCNGGYSIRISGKGRVIFEGRGMFGSETHAASLPKNKVRDLLSLARTADYFSLESSYNGDWIDPHSATTTTISIDGKTKSVEDSDGPTAGMPDIVGKFENAIDEVADAKGWRSDYSGAGCR